MIYFMILYDYIWFWYSIYHVYIFVLIYLCTYNYTRIYSYTHILYTYIFIYLYIYIYTSPFFALFAFRWCITYIFIRHVFQEKSPLAKAETGTLWLWQRSLLLGGKGSWLQFSWSTFSAACLSCWWITTFWLETSKIHSRYYGFG